MFDEDREQWAAVRAELRGLLGEDGYAGARRTTINAHYTDPAVVAAIWQTVRRAGFDGGRVLEPGCGAGMFLGLAPAGAELTGVELDPASARLARALYPHATVRAESFADTRLPAGHFDLTVGNVPFADVRAARPAAQPRAALDPQPLHPEVARADPPGRAGGRAELAVHAGRGEPGRAAGDERAGRSRRRRAATDRLAPPRRRHRRGDGPADVPPPRGRRAARRR